MYKLIIGAFPHHFKDNSIYAHHPFVIPSENLIIQKDLGRAQKYSWTKPAYIPELVAIKSYAACKAILEDKTNWKVTWGEAISFITSQPKKVNGLDFCLAGDGLVNAQSRKIVQRGMYPRNWHADVKSFYENTTIKLLKKYSHKLPGKDIYEVDIVRDVSNLVNARFAASVFSLPIKTEEHPHGIYTEQEMYQVLSVFFICIFFNSEPVKSMQIREAAHLLGQQLGELILLNTEAIAATGFIADVLAKLHRGTGLTDYGTHMIQRFLEAKMPIKDIVWSQM